MLAKQQLAPKGVEKIHLLTKGGKQSVYFISEPNLYRVIFRSNKKEAQQFQDWVFEEVFPSIRKTDKYEAPQVAEEYITSAQYHELKHLVYLIGNCFHYKNAAQWAVWSTLRKALFAEAAVKIPASRYNDAKDILNDIQQATEAFKSAVLEIETLFFQH